MHHTLPYSIRWWCHNNKDNTYRGSTRASVAIITTSALQRRKRLDQRDVCRIGHQSDITSCWKQIKCSVYFYKQSQLNIKTFNSQKVQEVRGGLSHQGDHEHPAEDKNQNNISEIAVNQMKLKNCFDQHVNCDEIQTYHSAGDTVLTRGTSLSL